jgi:hypothetical protein
MSNRPDCSPELTPEAVEILKGIVEETTVLRQVDVGNTPPSTVFEAE